MYRSSLREKKSYLMVKVYLILSIIILLVTTLMTGVLYKNQLNGRIISYHYLLNALDNTYIHEMVSDNERQLNILSSSLDRTRIQKGITPINPVWFTAHKFKQDIEHHIYFYNVKTKKITYYPHAEMPDYDPQERPWYKILNSEDYNPIWVGPYIDYDTQQNVLTLGQRVQDRSGHTLGIMMVDMDVDRIDEVLSRVAPVLGVSLFIRHRDTNQLISNSTERQFDFSNKISNDNFVFFSGLFDGVLITVPLDYVKWEVGVYIPAQRVRNLLMEQISIILLPMLGISLVAFLGVQSLLKVFRQELNILEKQLASWDEGNKKPTNKNHAWFVDKSLTKIEQQYSRHHELLRVDTLTRIQNRRAFDLDLAAMAENQQSPYALLLIDVDKFKHVNDTWGHQFGDNVLSRVAQVLTKNLDTHSIYRIGGDEFAALVPVNDDAPLGEQLNRLMLDMRQQKWREQGCHVTLSIGVSIGPNAPCELVNQADKALYRSKENGRDCWSMA